MANMLETMLHVQLLETGKMPAKHEPVLLDQLVDECAQAVRPLLDKDQIRIDVKVEQPPGGLIADGTLLIRVVNNLLFNAIRFSPAGGRIGVWSQTSDRWVVLNVADEGPGIPPDQRESVFEKGFGSGGYRSGGGLGLGLAFCKMAVEAMRGRIWVEEMSQAGALFRVALPLPTPLRYIDELPCRSRMERAYETSAGQKYHYH
jgi:signal transduction histidine kinase